MWPYLYENRPNASKMCIWNVIRFHILNQQNTFCNLQGILMQYHVRQKPDKICVPNKQKVIVKLSCLFLIKLVSYCSNYFGKIFAVIESTKNWDFYFYKYIIVVSFDNTCLKCCCFANNYNISKAMPISKILVLFKFQSFND